MAREKEKKTKAVEVDDNMGQPRLSLHIQNNNEIQIGRRNGIVGREEPKMDQQYCTGLRKARRQIDAVSSEWNIGSNA